MNSDDRKVPFIMANIKKCRCDFCPVQAESRCSKGKTQKLKDMNIELMPQEEDVPRLYCSSGVARCQDLKLDQMCICGSCPVWEECKLSKNKPLMHYCRDGRPH